MRKLISYTLLALGVLAISIFAGVGGEMARHSIWKWMGWL